MAAAMQEVEKVRVGKFKDLNTLPTTLSSTEQMVRWVVVGKIVQPSRLTQISWQRARHRQQVGRSTYN